MHTHLRFFALFILLIGSCASPPVATFAVVEEASPVEDPDATIELVVTVPVESEFDGLGLPETHRVWMEMIEGARSSLDIAQFYISNQKDSRLEPVIRAVEAAAERGVVVRLLAEDKFHATYPETLERLGARDGIELRRYDISERTGGILHAKYFLVDGRELFVGSQNFDWRALEHIQELGVRTNAEPVVRSVAAVFEADWALAGGEDAFADRKAAVPASMRLPTEASFGDEAQEIVAVFSPKELLPEGAVWDLPELVELIDSATKTVRIQLLSYKTTDRDGVYFAELESAIRRAAARRVRVQLMMSHWSKRRWTIEGLQSLQALPYIEVKLVTVPEWSGGFIPFGRVVHAKYLVVDGERSWLGTSNWSRDYFHASRNVGLVIKGAAVGARLDEFFAGAWDGPYAEKVDPSKRYEAPRVAE